MQYIFDPSIWTFATWIKYEKDLELSTYLQPLFWVTVIGASLDFQILISPFRWCISKDKKQQRDEFGTIRDLYNYGVPSYHVAFDLPHYESFVEHAP